MYSERDMHPVMLQLDDHTYVGVGKDVGKDWNACFITFVPFLCGLTVKLYVFIASLCERNPINSCCFSKQKMAHLFNNYNWCRLCMVCGLLETARRYISFEVRRATSS